MLFQDEDKINLDEDNIEVVDRFTYLSNVLSMEKEARDAATISAARNKKRGAKFFCDD